MATIKSFTSLEQSKKLAEILSLESADMYWQSNLNSSDRQYLLDMGEEEYFDIEMNFEHCSIGDYDVPAWSLAALLDVLPNESDIVKGQSDDKDERYMCTVGYKNDILSTFSDNPVDACYRLILKLHKLKML